MGSDDLNAVFVDAAIDLGGGNSLDPVRNVVHQSQGDAPVTPLVARFLQMLVAADGKIVAREAIIDALWQGNSLVGDPGLNRVVSEARRALGDDPRNPTFIQTIPRRGYRLVKGAATAESAASVSPSGVVSASPNAGEWLSPGRFWRLIILIVLGTVALKVLLDALVPLF
jgi:DNA-binding winged helix-turn-helix (wHTH) protein